MEEQVLKRNNCVNLVNTGPPGTGKSWALLSLFNQINPDFQLEGNWFFSAAKFMKAVKSEDHKPGKLWGLDEAGIDLNNLNYFNELNKGLNAFFQTARHRRYIFGMTVPFLDMVSKGVRTLMTAQFRAEGWVKRKNLSIIKPFSLEYNPEYHKFYRKRLLVKCGDKITRCNKIYLPKPPKHIVREYEKRKKEFTSKLFDSIAERMDAFEKKEERETRAMQKPLTPAQEQILEKLRDGKVVYEIAQDLGITKRAVYEFMKLLKKKGAKITPFRGMDNKVHGYKVEY
jgi:DNA-binding CsgD family transcriptional regulator